MSWTLFVNSSTGVTFDPEYGFTHADKSIDNSMRTRSSALFEYQYGEYRGWKIPIRFVSSSDKETINTWWRNKQELWLADDNATYPAGHYAVKLINKSTPINKPEKPYDYEWSGKLELEEF